MQSWHSQTKARKGNGGKVEKVPMPDWGVQRKGNASSMASRVSRPLEFIPERKCHNSIFQQHKLNLLLPKSAFKKYKSESVSPGPPSCPRRLLLQVGLWRAGTFRYPSPRWQGDCTPVPLSQHGINLRQVASITKPLHGAAHTHKPRRLGRACSPRSSGEGNLARRGMAAGRRLSGCGTVVLSCPVGPCGSLSVG